MAVIIDDLTIINAALIRIGSAPIFAVDEDTELAAQVMAIYATRRDALLGLSAWEFAKRTNMLDLVAETAANGYSSTNLWGNGYRYAFAMPGDRIGTPRKVLTNARQPNLPLRDFILEAGRLYADRNPLWATFTVRADPNIWPPAFRMAAEVLCAADFAVPVSHDATLAADLRSIGEGPEAQMGLGGLVAKALAADVSGSPGPAPLQMADDLTTAHMS